MSRVVVTGGAGFIGSHLVHELLARGVDVLVVDDLSLGRRDYLPEDIHFLRGNVGSKETWEQVGETRAADVAVHLAGVSSAPMFAADPAESFGSNVSGFLRLLEWARQTNCRRVIFASTSSIYGNVGGALREDGPVDLPNLYAASKLSMEQVGRLYARRYGIDVVGFRFMSVYGPREEHKGRYANLVSQFVWASENGTPPVIYGNGEQTRDFTHVSDVVAALMAAIGYQGALGNDLFNVGTGRSCSLKRLVELIASISGRDVAPVFIPNPVMEGYVTEQRADLLHIRSVLGFEATVPLEEGIRNLIEAHRTARKTAP